MAVDEIAVDGGQTIIHHHIRPLPKDPETKMKDSCIVFWMFGIPFLLLPIRNNLEKDIVHSVALGDI